MKLDEGFLHSMQDAMKLLRTRGPQEAAASAAARAWVGRRGTCLIHRRVMLPVFNSPAHLQRIRLRTPPVIGPTSCTCRSTIAASRCRSW